MANLSRMRGRGRAINAHFGINDLVRAICMERRVDFTFKKQIRLISGNNINTSSRVVGNIRGLIDKLGKGMFVENSSEIQTKIIIFRAIPLSKVSI